MGGFWGPPWPPTACMQAGGLVSGSLSAEERTEEEGTPSLQWTQVESVQAWPPAWLGSGQNTQVQGYGAGDLNRAPPSTRGSSATAPGLQVSTTCSTHARLVPRNSHHTSQDSGSRAGTQAAGETSGCSLRQGGLSRTVGKVGGSKVLASCWSPACKPSLVKGPRGARHPCRACSPETPAQGLAP